MPAISLPQAGRPYVLIEGTGSALDLRTDELLALYQSHGALLLRGFDGGLDGFGAFAGQFCATSVFNESPGRAPLDVAANIHTVNLGAEPFPLHPELSREPWKPDVCFFHCLTPPAHGGATTICDGVALAAALPAEVRAGLEGRRLVYVQPTWPELLDYWLGTPQPDDAQLAAPPPSCPYEFRRIGGQVARLFSRPALHRPMFGEGPAFGNFLLFSRFHNARGDFPVLDDARPVPEAWLQAIKAAGDSLSAEIGWAEGDTLMLDNSRFMHGRTAITAPAERLIAAHFGYLAGAPRNPEEPPDPPWRRPGFRPPVNPNIAAPAPATS